MSVIRIDQEIAEPRFERVLLTPKLAREWLDKAAPNRRVSQRWVSELAGIISRGNWEPDNGMTIKFNVDGEMFDGQHRCRAVISCGIPIPAWVVWNARDPDWETVDNTKPRTLNQRLSLMGEKNANVLGGILNRLWRFDKFGHPESRMRTLPLDLLPSALRLWPESRQAAEWASSGSIKAMTWPVASGFVFSLTLRLNRSAARRYYDLLETGANLALGSPILALREALFRIKSLAVFNHSRDRRIAMMLAMIDGWNAWRQDRTIKQIKIRRQHIERREWIDLEE
jgi:hypothetical protein